MISMLTPGQRDLHAVMEGLREPLAVCDAGGRVLSANGMARSLLESTFALGAEDFVGFDLAPTSTAHPSVSTAPSRDSATLLASADVLTLSDRSPTPEPNARGWTGWTVVGVLDLVAVPLPSGGFWVRLGSMGLSIHRELDAKLVEADRFISFGRLAAGIAHELKNPLTSISAYSDYLLSKYRDQLLDPRDADRFEQIITSVTRIDRFVADLLSYARPHDEEPVEMSLHARCNEALLLCEVSLRGVDVELDFGASSDRIYAVGSHIHQILINLLTNAASSMTEGAKVVKVETRNHNGSVLLAVSDRGHGIAEDTLDRIFEPFWTSRADKGGTGLGLAIVRGLVQRIGGTIAVETEVNVGSRFTITFPGA